VCPRTVTFSASGAIQTTYPKPRVDGSRKITNIVVTTQSANATIALGGSPIMATSPEEMEDLAKIPGGLLINFGTLTSLEGMTVAGMDSPLGSASHNSQRTKGNTRIKIKNLSFLTR
jgi:hypothetical protein